LNLRNKISVSPSNNAYKSDLITFIFDYLQKKMQEMLLHLKSGRRYFLFPILQGRDFRERKVLPRLLFFRISNLHSVKKYYLSTPATPGTISQHTVWHLNSFKKTLLFLICIQFYLLKGPFVSILHYWAANNVVTGFLRF